MSWPERVRSTLAVAAVVGWVVGGCEPKLDHIDGGEGPTTTADDVGGDGGSTGAPEPAPPPGECEDCQAHCAQIPIYDDCNQPLVRSDGQPAGWCRWVMYAAVEYNGATDLCSYGQTMGTCMYEAAPTGECDNRESCNVDADDILFDGAGLGVAGNFCRTPEPLLDLERCTGATDDPPVCNCLCGARWWKGC